MAKLTVDLLTGKAHLLAGEFGGEPGVQGVQGLQGTEGSQGVQGLQGTEGSQGVQGLQGLQGTEGSQGTQGLQGIQGVEPDISNKVDIIDNSLTGIHVLTQAEYDALVAANEDVSTVVYLIKE